MSTENIVTRFRLACLQQRVIERFAAGPLDLKAAEAESAKAEARYKQNAKAFADLKKGADSVKAGKLIDKLLDNGNAAERAAKVMISTYSRSARGPVAKAAMQWLNECIRQWRQYSGFGSLGGSASEMQSNIYAGAQQLEAALKNIDRSLKGEDVMLDESWRSH